MHENLNKKLDKFKFKRRLNRFDEFDSSSLTKLFNNGEFKKFSGRYSGEISKVPVRIYPGKTSWFIKALSQNDLDTAYNRYLEVYSGLRRE